MGGKGRGCLGSRGLLKEGHHQRACRKGRLRKQVARRGCKRQEQSLDACAHAPLVRSLSALFGFLRHAISLFVSLAALPHPATHTPHRHPLPVLCFTHLPPLTPYSPLILLSPPPRLHPLTLPCSSRWSDYQVEFHFPEPTDLGNNSLMQLIDADFKYPSGSWAFLGGGKRGGGEGRGRGRAEAGAWDGRAGQGKGAMGAPSYS